jgi:hypothetical protein
MLTARLHYARLTDALPGQIKYERVELGSTQAVTHVSHKAFLAQELRASLEI